MLACNLVGQAHAPTRHSLFSCPSCQPCRHQALLELVYRIEDVIAGADLGWPAKSAKIRRSLENHAPRKQNLTLTPVFTVQIALNYGGGGGSRSIESRGRPQQSRAKWQSSRTGKLHGQNRIASKMKFLWHVAPRRDMRLAIKSAASRTSTSSHVGPMASSYNNLFR